MSEEMFQAPTTGKSADATDSAASHTAARIADLEEEVGILSDVVHDFLNAHGETYTGALEHLEQLRAARAKRR